MIPKQDSFSLANFEGSLDFLLCLIQKEEIDIYDVPIQKLMQQFITKLAEWEGKQLERGADFIGTAAYLVWLKSKTLLPCDEQSLEMEELFEDPHFEIIHHLIDYCRFKQAAKDLTLLQEKQQACYFRGIDRPEWKKPLGINHVSLDELDLLFKEMMSRVQQTQVSIYEDHWRVSDKVHFIRHRLKECDHFPLNLLFTSLQPRLEIVVIFLAILELMKTGELRVGREQESNTLLVFSKNEEQE